MNNDNGPFKYCFSFIASFSQKSCNDFHHSHGEGRPATYNLARRHIFYKIRMRKCAQSVICYEE